MLSRRDLAQVRTIYLTTFGRQSGLPRTVEIWWFCVDDRFIITGTPGRRDWLANVRSHPRVVINASGFEIETPVREIHDPGFRRRVFSHRETGWYSSQAELERLVERAPMIEVMIDASD